MVARYRVWIALGLGLLSASLAPGCRKFPVSGDPSGGSGGGGGSGESQGAATGEAGSDGEAGAIGDVNGSGGAGGSTLNGGSGIGGALGTSGAGGSTTGGIQPLGGTGSEPEFSGREIEFSTGKTPNVSTQWTRVVPFADQGAPYFATYHDETGIVTFRSLDDQYQGASSQVWSGEWAPDLTAFSRLTPKGIERLVLYWKDTGIRQLVTIRQEPEHLQGVQVLLETSVGKGFTHHTNDIAPTGLPYLYWYEQGSAAGSENLLIEILDAEGKTSATSFPGMVGNNYSALTAVGDRLLGFHPPNFDVFDLVELGTSQEPTPIYLTGLGSLEQVVAFELDGIPLLFLYNLTGNSKVIELAWEGDQVRSKELWVSSNGDTMGNAASVSGLNLPGEQLIFLHSATAEMPELQVVGFTLKLDP